VVRSTLSESTDLPHGLRRHEGLGHILREFHEGRRGKYMPKVSSRILILWSVQSAVYR